MFRPKRPRLKGLSFNRMIPNILTLLALCAGVTSMRFGLHGEWEHGVAAIIFAAVLDGIDGRIARLLRGTTKFGAELDSLSDFVSFGVAPAMLLYLWTMQNAGGFGWALVLLFSVSSALRLARFNTMLGEAPSWAYNFFTGMPTPAAGGLVLVPMTLWFRTGAPVFRHPALVSVVLIVISFLMVSQVPTYSFKRFRIPHKWVLPIMLLVGLLAAFLVSEPWITLGV
ncbi:MAG: CDP-diacylglycerol--serine O-phosphatidyltransferase, partial [Alphaproteobacteria bacterium]|nr:CDP-diacylglycerol--serine O-phosphatidyltransferase [Alphaproteobacteria bacterium]